MVGSISQNPRVPSRFNSRIYEWTKAKNRNVQASFMQSFTSSHHSNALFISSYMTNPIYMRSIDAEHIEMLSTGSLVTS